MAIDPKFLEVGGREYRLEPFGYDDWLRLTAELGAISGPAAGAALAIKQGQSVDAGAAIRDLALALLGSMDGGLLNRLYANLSWNETPGAQKGWQRLDRKGLRDAAWSGRYMDGMRCLIWVLEVAFEGFLQAAIDAVPGLSKGLSRVATAAGISEEKEARPRERDSESSSELER